VLLFSLAIFVHELGHYLAARRLGLVVDTFAIGFGPALWKRKIGATVYKICLVPFGGYVALPQLDPSGMETVQGENAADKADEPKRDLPDIAPWKRVVVSVAGPAGNVVLAVALAWVIWAAPGAVTGGADTVVGTVDEDSPAWHAGIRAGQTILRVNDTRVRTWFDFMVECHLSGDPSNGVQVVVLDGSAERAVTLYPTNVVEDLRYVAGLSPKSQCYVEHVRSNSVAAAAGVLPGDIVRALNGRTVVSMSQFVEGVGANGEKLMRLSLLRGRAPVEVEMTPRLDPEVNRVRIGVELRDAIRDVPVWMQYSSPLRQLSADGASVFRILRALFLPQTRGESKRAAQSVGGPVLIMVSLWNAVRESFLSSLGFLRCICVNLAIINLLPFPVLDGGHIVFACWEIITRRKPHPRVVNTLVNGFAVLLISLMLLLVFRDARRLHRARARHAPLPAVATETNAVAPVTTAEEAPR
jgi:regulator of sigma E protease